MDKGGKRGESIAENVRVYCRVRPDMPEESPEAGEEENLYLTGGMGDQETGGSRIINIDETNNQCTYLSSATNAEQKFKMDGFFGPDTDQATVTIAQAQAPPPPPPPPPHST